MMNHLFNAIVIAVLVGTVVMACDVSDYAAVEKVVADTKARLGSLDILVNNAGVIEPISEIATSDPKVWASNITINLVGAYNVVRAVLPGMS